MIHANKLHKLERSIKFYEHGIEVYRDGPVEHSNHQSDRLPGQRTAINSDDLEPHVRSSLWVTYSNCTDDQVLSLRRGEGLR